MQLREEKVLSKIDVILNESIWLLHEDKSNSELDYLSRIETEKTAWYFWLKDSQGVYELSLKNLIQTERTEESHFFLKYYPALEEDVLDAYSCAEQLLRRSDFFDQNKIVMADKIELCPCCGGQHVKTHQHVQRNKGIPKILLRKNIVKRLFEIGTVIFKVNKNKIFSVTLKTSDRLIEYMINGIEIKDQAGIKRELIEKNGIDRDVPGYKLSCTFYHFLVSKILGANNEKSPMIIMNTGFAIDNFGQNILKERRSNEVKEIVITNILGKEEE